MGVDSYAGTPLFDAAGRPIGIMVVLFEAAISDAGLASSALRIFATRAAAELERKRTEEQLFHAQKLESVGRLASGVAHDFNNLLTCIIGAGWLLRTGLPVDDTLHRYLATMLEAANRGANLTRQLLAFSRKQILQPVVLSLNTVVSDMDTFLRRLIGEDIELCTDLAAQLGNVKVDAAAPATSAGARRFESTCHTRRPKSPRRSARRSRSRPVAPKRSYWSKTKSASASWQRRSSRKVAIVCCPRDRGILRWRSPHGTIRQSISCSPTS